MFQIVRQSPDSRAGDELARAARSAARVSGIIARRRRKMAAVTPGG